MKTKDIKKRLNLNKKTIANLDSARMMEVIGGTGGTTGPDDTVIGCPPKIPTTKCT